MKTLACTIEKQYEITLADSCLTEEFVKDFEKSFWELDGDTLEEKYDDLYKVAAYQLAKGETRFIEGLGPCISQNMVYYYPENVQVAVIYDEIYDELEVE